MALDRHAPAGLLEDQLDGELAWRWRGWTRLDAVVVVAVDGDGMRCAVRVGGTAMVVVVMLWDLTRLLVMSARRLAGVDGLQGHVPAPVGSHGLVIIPVLVVAGRGRARRRGRRASLSLRESLEEKVVVERVRHRGRRRGRGGGFDAWRAATAASRASRKEPSISSTSNGISIVPPSRRGNLTMVWYSGVHNF